MSSIRTDTACSTASVPSAVHGYGRRLRGSLPILLLLVLAPPAPAAAQDAADPLPAIELVRDGSGTRLRVDGRDVMVQGVNWDYFPRGTTYNYNFWAEPDHIIEAALEREMSVLRAMGATRSAPMWGSRRSGFATFTSATESSRSSIMRWAATG